jgi:molecular chaperone GrpE (heat shock protein)
MKDIMLKYDIVEIEPTEEAFNPNYQESTVQIPTPSGSTKGHIAKTFRTAYTLRGRLLRSATVAVFN